MNVRNCLAVPLVLVLAACGGDDLPGAEPSESIAPAPHDSVFVPGAGEPGQNENP